MSFEWDDDKAARNAAARGLSIEALRELHGRKDDAFTSYDLDHSSDEDRFKTIGPVGGRLVTMIWTERGSGVRIITAWRASRAERVAYKEHFEGRI